MLNASFNTLFSCEKILEKRSLPVDILDLENDFLNRLVDMRFVSILLKPDLEKERTRDTETQSLRESQEQIDQRKNILDDSKIDVLCASFIC